MSTPRVPSASGPRHRCASGRRYGSGRFPRNPAPAQPLPLRPRGRSSPERFALVDATHGGAFGSTRSARGAAAHKTYTHSTRGTAPGRRAGLGAPLPSLQRAGAATRRRAAADACARGSSQRAAPRRWRRGERGGDVLPEAAAELADVRGASAAGAPPHLRPFAANRRCPHLRRDLARRRCHICTGTGAPLPTSAPGLGSPLPTSAPGLGCAGLGRSRRCSC